MAEWDWLPPAPVPVIETPEALMTPVPDESEAVWPEWLGGPPGGAPAAITTPAPAPAPSAVAVAPAAPSPAAGGDAPAEIDPLTGARIPTGLGVDLEFPPASWFASEGGDVPLEALAPGGSAAPPPEVDALSGGTPEPVADPDADPLRAQAGDQDPAGIEAARLASLSPEDYAAEVARAGAAKDAYVMEQKAEALRQNRERIEANERRLAEHREKAAKEYQEIAAEAKRIAETKIDPRGWFNNASTAQQMGAAVAAMIGGFNAPMYGGRNTGIEFVMGLVDRDLDTQKANLANRQQALGTRKGLVAELYAQGMDEYQAAETVRLATLQQLDDQLAVEASKFDPAGTTARRIAQARLEVRQAQAEAAAKAEQQLYERKVTADASKRDWARIHEQRTARIESGRRADRAFDLEQDKLDLEYGKLEAEERRAQETRQRELGLGTPGELTNRDGTPFQARSKEVGDALAKKKAAVDQAAQLIDEIVELRREHGWEPDALKGEALQKMKGNVSALQLLVKDTAELGVLAGPDMEIIDRYIGTGDPSEVRDSTAGLLNARKNMVESFDSQLRANQYDGPYYVPSKADDFRAQKAKEASQLKTFDDYLGVINSPSSTPEERQVAHEAARKMAGDDLDKWQRLADVSVMGQARRHAHASAGKGL